MRSSWLVHCTWRMDETAVRVRGGRHYLYRAADRNGKSVGSLLCVDRSMEFAQAFFRKSVSGKCVVLPSKINLDGYTASHRALRILSQEDPRWRSVVVRSSVSVHPEASFLIDSVRVQLNAGDSRRTVFSRAWV